MIKFEKKWIAVENYIIWNHISVKKFIEENKKESDNPIQLIKNKSRNLVLKAMEQGWSGPPFNALELTKLLNIKTKPNENIKDARIFKSGCDFVIEYNPFQKPTRLNFSIAHEISHTFFSDFHEKIRNREENPGQEKELEQLCNIGAAEIQLPYAFFSNDANKIEYPNLEELITLAKQYKSSLESLFIRFSDIYDGEFAFLVAQLNTNGDLEVEYCSKTNRFGQNIDKDFKIPKNSKAYESLFPGWSARETVDWEFFDKKYDIFSIGLSPLRHTHTPRVGIIIIPNNPSKSRNNKITIEYGDATKFRGNKKTAILQIINTSGALGKGFGKSLSKNYSDVKEAVQNWKKDKNKFQLGNSNVVTIDKKNVVYQILAQKGLYSKSGCVLLNYNALRKGLQSLSEFAQQNGFDVQMPLIGAGNAGGNWEIISGMIHDELILKGIKVSIYILPGNNPITFNTNSLIDFKEQSTWQKELPF